MPDYVVELEEKRTYQMKYRVSADNKAEAARLAIEDETGPQVKTIWEEVKEVTGCELVEVTEEKPDAAHPEAEAGQP